VEGLFYPGPCAAAGIANAQVDPRWRPYIGEISWEDIQKQLNAGSKKHGKRKMGKGKAKAKSKAAGAAGKLDGEAEAEAENVIAAYTGGLDQS